MSPNMRGHYLLTGPRSLVGRIIGALVTLGALVVGLMFSVVLFGVALVLGLAAWGGLWWKMRRVIRRAQQDPHFAQFRGMASGAAARPPGDGDVIEGEVLRGQWQDERGNRG